MFLLLNSNPLSNLVILCCGSRSGKTFLLFTIVSSKCYLKMYVVGVGLVRPTLSERKKVKLLSRVRLFATPWTVAYQGPLSMGFSRQEYWRGLPFPSPGDLPDPGIEPRSPA